MIKIFEIHNQFKALYALCPLLHALCPMPSALCPMPHVLPHVLCPKSCQIYAGNKFEGETAIL